jgi:hypothetical protein
MRREVPAGQAGAVRSTPFPEGRVQPGTRMLLVAFAGLTLLAVSELLISPPTAGEQFAWRIDRQVTAGFLGAAFAAGCVLSVLSLRRRRWADIRVPVLTVGAFTALTLVATLVHAHRLLLSDGDPATRLAAWVWLGVYLVVPFVCLTVIGRQEIVRGPAPAVRRPMPTWLAAALGAQGLVLGAAGAVLFVGNLVVHHHATAVTGPWPWQLTPLSGQVVGAWLLAFALAAALAIAERDLDRLRVPAAAYTVFALLELLVLVRYRAEVDAGDPRLWGYVLLLVAAVLTGGYGCWAARRPLPASGAQGAQTLPAAGRADTGDGRPASSATRAAAAARSRALPSATAAACSCAESAVCVSAT